MKTLTLIGVDSSGKQSSEPYTITLNNVKFITANCNVVIKSINFDSNMPFTFNAKKDLALETGFIANNMKVLKGGNNSKFYINEGLEPEVNGTSLLPPSTGEYIELYDYESSDYGKISDYWGGNKGAAGYAITNYAGTSDNAIVPAKAQNVYVVELPSDAFTTKSTNGNMKDTMTSIGLGSGKYTVESGTFSGFTKLKKRVLAQ